jgi:alkylation response protein AidB-like acyl-CoA dehydrogenase
MNLELTDEQLSLRDTLRRFLAERAPVAGHVRPMLDSRTGTTDAVWHGLADLGATGLLVPPECGGAGATMTEAGIVAEELGAALHPGPWLSTAVAAPRALSAAGGAEQALLAGIADGSTIATVGPLNGARPTTDGATLIGKCELPDAAAADVLLVLADSTSGIHLFAVDAFTVTMTPLTGIDATRKRFRVTLDETPGRIVGSMTEETIVAIIDDVLVAHAADAVGAAQAVLDLAVEYAKTRRQFGQPIGAFQSVQHLCVDMYETVELARSGVIHALWAADAADGHERHTAAVRAKAFAGQLATVGDSAIQVFGGIGYTWEHNAHLYLKRLLSWSEFLGGPGEYLKRVGMSLIPGARS